MRLPRDVSGERLATLLRCHGDEITRQTGSHLRLTSTVRGGEHHITILRHDVLEVGTLGGVLAEVSTYLELGRKELQETLFGR